ncbi:hypothetical protein ACMGE6_10610 [Macrococcus equi]|uniref:hypothetical protein n=1 Tax=Macrococcus equi TaxID=3395462 RepID=UPI0039BE4F66
MNTTERLTNNFNKLVTEQQDELKQFEIKIEAKEDEITEYEHEIKTALLNSSLVEADRFKAKKATAEEELKTLKEVKERLIKTHASIRQPELISLLNSRASVPANYAEEIKAARAQLHSAVEAYNEAVTVVDELNKKIYQEQYNFNYIYNQYPQDHEAIAPHISRFNTPFTNTPVFSLGTLTPTGAIKSFKQDILESILSGKTGVNLNN